MLLLLLLLFPEFSWIKIFFLFVCLPKFSHTLFMNKTRILCSISLCVHFWYDSLEKNRTFFGEQNQWQREKPIPTKMKKKQTRPKSFSFDNHRYRYTTTTFQPSSTFFFLLFPPQYVHYFPINLIADVTCVFLFVCLFYPFIHLFIRFSFRPKVHFKSFDYHYIADCEYTYEFQSHHHRCYWWCSLTTKKKETTTAIVIVIIIMMTKKRTKEKEKKTWCPNRSQQQKQQQRKKTTNKDGDDYDDDDDVDDNKKKMAKNVVTSCFILFYNLVLTIAIFSSSSSFAFVYQ